MICASHFLGSMENLETKSDMEAETDAENGKRPLPVHIYKQTCI